MVRLFFVALIALVLSAQIPHARAFAPRTIDSPEIRAQLPAALWELLVREQRLNNKIVNPKLLYRHNNEQTAAYAPSSGMVFEIQGFWVSEDKLRLFQGDGMSPALEKVFHRTQNGNSEYLLLVHPESMDHYASVIKKAEAGPVFLATPTASSRTLLMWREGVQPFFGKLSLDRELGGMVRTIPTRAVARGIGVNNILQTIKTTLPKGVAFFSETLGIAPKGMERGGMMLREIPPEILSGETSLVPFFSLNATPKDGSPPLMVEMAKKLSMNVEDFVKEYLVSPFLAQWVEFALAQGITMEPHGQNLLLEIGRDGLPTGRIFYRDLDGFNVDIGFRRTHGLPMPKRLHYVGSLHNTYFDSKFGAYAVDSIVNYLYGGFLFEVQKLLPMWVEKKWIKQAEHRISIRKMLRVALGDELAKQSGRESVAIKSDYSNLRRIILRLRESVVCSRSLTSK